MPESGRRLRRRWIWSASTVALAAGLAPFAGPSAFAGTGTSVKVHGLTVGHAYTVVVYTVDKYGNVSSPVTRKIVLA